MKKKNTEQREAVRAAQDNGSSMIQSKSGGFKLTTAEGWVSKWHQDRTTCYKELRLSRARRRKGKK